jgi:hypothetical protein
MTPKRLFIAVAALFGAALIFFLSIQWANAVPPITAREQFLLTEIAALQTQRATTTATEAQGSLDEKIALFIRDATEAAHPRVTLTPGPTVTAPPVATPIFETGIFTGGSPFIESSQALIVNRWKGVVNGQYVVIHAGASGANPAKGIVVARIMTNELVDFEWHYYETLTETGVLTITSAVDDVVVMTSASGATIFFDSKSMQYVSEADDIMPTITPLPKRQP